MNYMKKQCKVCTATLTANKFKPDKRSKDGLASTCNSCLDDRECHVGVREIHEQMYVKQNQCCAICGRKVSISKILVDHDRSDMHEEVKGLVCHRCNNLLRLIGRELGVAQALVEYLAPAKVSSPPPPVDPPRPPGRHEVA